MSVCVSVPQSATVYRTNDSENWYSAGYPNTPEDVHLEANYLILHFKEGLHRDTLDNVFETVSDLYFISG